MRRRASDDAEPRHCISVKTENYGEKMAFDAFMVAAVTWEINSSLSEAKVEKVQQPEKDEIVLLLHKGRDTFRLSLSAGANCPRINITSALKENPVQAPMFCMLLRKHLQGGKLVCARQPEFEREVELEFECYDELGFQTKKYLIAEIMGKYSNIIFCDVNKKILGAIKVVDFSTSQKRQVLPGMIYEMPPKQDRRNPLELDESDFYSLRSSQPDVPGEKFLTGNYLGISALTARQLAYEGQSDDRMLYSALRKAVDRVFTGNFTPVLVKNKDGSAMEYSSVPITLYGGDVICEEKESFGQLIDEYFGSREKAERIKQRGNDILKLLTNIETRLKKKIALQTEDLAKCAEKDTLRLYGDLITANIYRMKRGEKSVMLVNYYDENSAEIEIELDSRLTPAQNAQRYYKKYNKAKSAEAELTKQLELAKAELDYIYTVFDSAVKAEGESDLTEIRHELYQSGYASRMKDYVNLTAQMKKRQIKPMELVTENGYRLLVGKNNTQNDFVTTKCAEKSDYWFHVKNAPGSHVLMMCGGEEPPEKDFTQAAEAAAYYSSLRGGQNIAVDYTFAKNVKKPAGSKPGFVIYNTNWTAYVTPTEAGIEAMKK